MGYIGQDSDAERALDNATAAADEADSKATGDELEVTEDAEPSTDVDEA